LKSTGFRLKETGKIAFGKPKAPNISLKELEPPKLKVNIRPTPISNILTKPLKLSVKVLQVEETTNLRVSVYEPLTIQIYSLLQPKIKIEPPQDFSVRPLFRSELIKDMGILMFFIRPTRVIFQRPDTVPIFLERNPVVYMPRIHVMPLIKEGVERRQIAIQVPQQPITKPRVEASEISAEMGKGGAEPELEAENVLDELLPTLKGKGLEFSFQRPLCLIVLGESSDGLGMVEHLMAIKYAYHGEYRFFMKLPRQKEFMLSKIAEGRLRKAGVKDIPSLITEKAEEDPYALITSDHLIVSIPIPSISEESIMKIIRGLKEISKRGPKCVIIYSREAGPLENLDEEVPDVDVVIAALPKFNEKLPKLIGEILGIELPPTVYETRIDNLWNFAVKLYEEEMKRLDNKLPTKGVDFFPGRESLFHYLMKKIVYWYLKESGYTHVKTEELKPLINEAGQFVGHVIPDIVADDECWEVETGYPSEEERTLIVEPWDPRARLIWKLSRYKGSPRRSV